MPEETTLPETPEKEMKKTRLMAFMPSSIQTKPRLPKANPVAMRTKKSHKIDQNHQKLDQSHNKMEEKEIMKSQGWSHAVEPVQDSCAPCHRRKCRSRRAS